MLTYKVINTVVLNLLKYQCIPNYRGKDKILVLSHLTYGKEISIHSVK